MNQSAKTRIFIQIAFWITIWLMIPFLLLNGQKFQALIPRAVVMLTGIITITYLNSWVLFPKYYKKGKIRTYIWAFLGSIIVLFTVLNIIALVLLDLEFSIEIDPAPRFLSDHGKQIFKVMDKLPPIILGSLVSTLFEISTYADQSAKEAAQLKSEKLEAELKFLKSQINPHFLFNALNNIYTLTVLDAKQAGENLLKLSTMLRYLLYECDADKVHLQQELAYLKNYIELFSLKDEEPLNIQMDITHTNHEVKIAPLLLIPFIENAFKHSYIEDIEKGWIQITLAGDDTIIHFKVSNSIPVESFEKDKVGGIGLQNVQRQLELLYPNQHQLTIEQTNTAFNIDLKLNLK